MSNVRSNCFQLFLISENGPWKCYGHSNQVWGSFYFVVVAIVLDTRRWWLFWLMVMLFSSTIIDHIVINDPKAYACSGSIVIIFSLNYKWFVDVWNSVLNHWLNRVRKPQTTLKSMTTMLINLLSSNVNEHRQWWKKMGAHNAKCTQCPQQKMAKHLQFTIGKWLINQMHKVRTMTMLKWFLYGLLDIRTHQVQ